MIIELLDGTRYDIENYSLKRLFHFIPSANIVHSNYEIQGRSDFITSSRFNNRVIRVELLYITQDIYDYYTLREQLNDLFMREEQFYIIFKREQHKRWLVKTNTQFEIPPNPKMQSFVIEFITQNFYAESSGSSIALQIRKEWDEEFWAWDSTINWDEQYNYIFNTNSFTVKNLGNIPVDPRYYGLEIIIDTGPNDSLEITNTTTGDVYAYNAPLVQGDILVVRGVRTYKNRISAFKDTNRRLLSLAVGDNQLQVTRGNINSITFDFRFLYK